MPRFVGMIVAIRESGPHRGGARPGWKSFPVYHDFNLFLRHLCRFADKIGCYIFLNRL
jgi:hypothetical protein